LSGWPSFSGWCVHAAAAFSSGFDRRSAIPRAHAGQISLAASSRPIFLNTPAVFSETETHSWSRSLRSSSRYASAARVRVASRTRRNASACPFTKPSREWTAGEGPVAVWLSAIVSLVVSSLFERHVFQHPVDREDGLVIRVQGVARQLPMVRQILQDPAAQEAPDPIPRRPLPLEHRQRFRRRHEHPRLRHLISYGR